MPSVFSPHRTRGKGAKIGIRRAGPPLHSTPTSTAFSDSSQIHGSFDDDSLSIDRTTPPPKRLLAVLVFASIMLAVVKVAYTLLMFVERCVIYLLQDPPPEVNEVNEAPEVVEDWPSSTPITELSTFDAFTGLILAPASTDGHFIVGIIALGLGVVGYFVTSDIQSHLLSSTLYPY